MKNLRTRRFTPTKGEQKYVLKEKRDLEILALCDKMEGKRLSKPDRKLVKLIKTQLEEDWRTPLLQALKNVARRLLRK